MRWTEHLFSFAFGDLVASWLCEWLTVHNYISQVESYKRKLLQIRDHQHLITLLFFLTNIIYNISTDATAILRY